MTYTLSLKDDSKTEYTTSQDAYYSSPTRSVRIDTHQDKCISGSIDYAEYSNIYTISKDNNSVYNLYVQGTQQYYYSEIEYKVTNISLTIKPKETEKYADLGDSTLVIYSYK